MIFMTESFKKCGKTRTGPLIHLLISSKSCNDIPFFQKKHELSQIKLNVIWCTSFTQNRNWQFSNHDHQTEQQDTSTAMATA